MIKADKTFYLIYVVKQKGRNKAEFSLNTKKNYIFIDDLAYLLRVIGPYGKKFL